MVHPVSNFIVAYFYWVFLALLALNVMQRRYRTEAPRKRMATLSFAIFVFVLYMYAYGIIRLGLSEWWLLAYGGIVGALLWFYRRTFLPFTFRCRSCSRTLTFERFFYSDSNLCGACAERNSPPQEPSRGPREQGGEPPSPAR